MLRMEERVEGRKKGIVNYSALSTGSQYQSVIIVGYSIFSCLLRDAKPKIVLKVWRRDPMEKKRTNKKR